MKTIFNTYGKVIVVAVAIVALIATATITVSGADGNGGVKAALGSVATGFLNDTDYDDGLSSSASSEWATKCEDGDEHRFYSIYDVWKNPTNDGLETLSSFSGMSVNDLKTMLSGMNESDFSDSKLINYTYCRCGRSEFKYAENTEYDTLDCEVCGSKLFSTYDCVLGCQHYHYGGEGWTKINDDIIVDKEHQHVACKGGSVDCIKIGNKTFTSCECGFVIET